MAAPMKTLIGRLPPVVVILGATGTGKSKLALQIGSRFGGEIISADSMQVYKGLDIITNKVTTDEQQSCPHHLIDFLNPLSRYTVVDFRNKALPIIEGLLGENRTPVIVGGTNYYIEALLWKVLVDTKLSPTEGLLLNVKGDPETLRIPRKRRHSEEDHSFPEEQTQSDADFESLRSLDNSREPTTSTGSRMKEAFKSGPEFGKRECQTSPTLDRRQETDSILPTATVCHHRQNVRVSDSLSADGQDDHSSRELVHQNDLEVFPEGHRGSWLDDCRERAELMTIDVERTETCDLYKVLEEVDPHRANTLHPNNRRKIIRSLQVYEQLGRTHSDLISGQKGEEGGGPLGGPLRFKDVCIFWLQCDKEVLDKRLDDRVDDMLRRGLLKELADFHREYNRQRVESQADSETLYTQGIFQSIGFKEFHPYLILPEEDRESDQARNYLKEGVEKLKQATRQYARRQNRWVKNRFVRRPGSNVPPVFALNSTDPTVWDEKVLQPALAILKALIEGKELPVDPLRPEEGSSSPSSSPAQEASAKYVCDVCDGRIFVGKQQWLGHLRSKRHYKKSRKLRIASLMKSHKEKMASRAEENERDVEDQDS